MQAVIQPDTLLRWTWQIYPNRTDRDATTLEKLSPKGSEESAQESTAVRLFRKLSLFKESATSTVLSSSNAIVPPPLGVPLACVYQPLLHLDAFKASSTQMLVSPWKCLKCGAILNSYCEREHDSAQQHVVNRWVCVFCRSVNQRPLNGQQVSYSPVCPADVSEYLIPQPELRTPVEVHCFVLDASVKINELLALTQRIVSVLQDLPPHTRVMLISYAEVVCVWELKDSTFTQCCVFSADRTYNETEICSHLQIAPGTCASEVNNAYVVPRAEADEAMSKILQHIIPNDGGGVGSSPCPKRCTGAALHIATCILNAIICPHVKAAGPLTGKCLNSYRIEMHTFIGGRITRGLGMPVEPESSFLSGAKEAAAKKLSIGVEGTDTSLWRSLQSILHCTQAIAVNLFICALDTVGLENLEPLARESGGIVFLHESFGSKIFEDTMSRHFQAAHRSQRMSDVIHSVHSTAETFVAGCIGHCREEGKPSKTGGQVSYRSSACEPESTLTLFFDSKPTEVGDTPSQQLDYDCHTVRVFQFQTAYTNRSGERVVRVTTARKGVGPYLQPNLRSIPFYKQSGGFDQQTAFVVMAKYIAHSMQQKRLPALQRYCVDFYAVPAVTQQDGEKVSPKSIYPFLRGFVEKLLILVYRLFASKSEDLPQSHAHLPVWFYHMLRSDIFQSFNASFDEQLYRINHLIGQDVNNTIKMIAPNVLRYACDTEENLRGVHVPLDTRVLQHDAVCILDAYFELIVFFGKSAHSWKQSKFHLNPAYPSFAALLEVVELHTNALFSRTKAAPLLIHCVEGDSKSRFASQYMSEVYPPYSAEYGKGAERVCLGSFLSACRERAFGPAQH